MDQAIEAKRVTNVELVMQFLGQVTYQEFIDKPCELVVQYINLTTATPSPNTGFDELFPLEDLASYRNESGLPLRGGRNQAWIQRRGYSEEQVLREQRKIFLEQTLVAYTRKLYELMQGKHYQNALHLKPAAEENTIQEALTKLQDIYTHLQ